MNKVFFFSLPRVDLMRIHTHRNGEIWGARARKRAFIQASLDLKMAAAGEMFRVCTRYCKCGCFTLAHTLDGLSECEIMMKYARTYTDTYTDTYTNKYHATGIHFHLISTTQMAPLVVGHTPLPMHTLVLVTCVCVFIFVSP